MFNKILKNRLWLVLLIFIIFNLILLYTTTKRELQINILTAQLSSLEANKGFSPKVLSFVKKETIPSTEGLSLFVLFSDQGCPLCLNYEVPNVNTLYQQFKNRVKIFFIGTNKKYLKQYGAAFPYAIKGSPKDILNEVNLTITNPVAILLDSSGMIHDIYIAEAGNNAKSNIFYQRMHSLFGSTSREVIK